MASIPGLDMAGSDPLLRTLLARGQESEDRIAGVERDVAASREREDVARTAQQAAMQPTQDRLKGMLAEGGPAAPAPLAIGPAPVQPTLDTKAMTETLSLITALAAIGGALTKQPLTAALNNFSSGVKGLVTGNQMVFQNSIKEFDANLKQAHAENAATWQRYQAARDKYKTDIVGLQNELKLIAAETQNPIDLELARRGDVVSLMKMREKSSADFDKVLTSVARMREAQVRHDEAVRHHKAMEANSALSTSRLAAGGVNAVNRDAKREDVLQREYQAEKRKLTDRLMTGKGGKITQEQHDQLQAQLIGQFKGRGMGGAAAPGAPAAAPAATPLSAPAPRAPQPPTKDAEGRLVFADPADLDAYASKLDDGAPIVVGGVVGKWKK